MTGMGFPSELSAKWSLFSCSASWLCPLVSRASKTECQVLSVSPVPGACSSHLRRTPRHASSALLGLFQFSVSITKDCTPRQSAACSHPLQRPTMSLSSSSSVGLEPTSSRELAPEKWQNARKRYEKWHLFAASYVLKSQIRCFDPNLGVLLKHGRAAPMYRGSKVRMQHYHWGGTLQYMVCNDFFTRTCQIYTCITW